MTAPLTPQEREGALALLVRAREEALGPWETDDDFERRRFARAALRQLGYSHDYAAVERTVAAVRLAAGVAGLGRLLPTALQGQASRALALYDAHLREVCEVLGGKGAAS